MAKRISLWQSCLDDNCVLGLCPCFKYTQQPTYRERFALLLLYLSTGLFIEHVELLSGSACQESYHDQCGAFVLERTVGHRPNSTVVEVLQSLPSSPVEADVKELSSGITERVADYRLEILEWLESNVEFNCSRPMCDLWAPLDIPLNVASEFDNRVMNLDGDHVTYVPGLCRCSGVFQQDAVNITLKLAISLVFQTLLPMIFRTLLSTGMEKAVGCAYCCNVFTNIMLVLVIVVQMAVVFLVRFDLHAWLLSVGVSLAYASTIMLLVSYIKLKICECCGCPCVGGEETEGPPETYAPPPSMSRAAPVEDYEASRAGMCGSPGSGNMCLEPEGSVRQVTWEFVGPGKGGYNKVNDFNYVGPKCGDYSKEPGGYDWKPALWCCLGLVLAAAVAAGLYYYLLTTFVLDPRESQLLSAHPDSRHAQQNGTTMPAAAPAKPAAAPTDRYDCLRNHSNWQHVWDLDKRAWCCRHKSKGCPPNHNYDCDEALGNWQRAWSVGKQHFCCGYDLSHCPASTSTTAAATTTTPYDCDDAPAGNADAPDWVKASGWSTSKRRWCCEHRHKGCEATTTEPTTTEPTTTAPTTTPEPFDCTLEVGNRDHAWSDAKKEWCCHEKSVGCTEPSSQPSGCDTVCTFHGQSQDCRSRVLWVASQELAGKPHACPFALGAVLKDCPVCGVCSVADTGCEALQDGDTEVRG